MADAQIPEGLTADYANTAVREAIEALQARPDYERLAAFLAALREGFLVADVTGTAKKKATHIRTIRSTDGRLVLPLFTSMAELRLAMPKGRGDQAKGALMPALEALRLIRTKPFVAAQFDVGSAALVVVRKYVDLALGDEPITAEALEAMA
ncbi:MAG: SseB family protein [Candidatus Leucobacter sulfamidivorax]|nr:SseB family protein [Candidatus Leucobacter sulfamidivorax]